MPQDSQIVPRLFSDSLFKRFAVYCLISGGGYRDLQTNEMDKIKEKTDDI